MAIRVLLVDEIEDDRELYGAGLRVLGYDVVLSHHSIAAQHACSVRPDVIVLHVGPDPGWPTCDELLGACGDIPVIALTAAVRPDGAHRARARSTPNCAAFVGKPCTNEDLDLLICRVIGGERQIEVTTAALPRRGSAGTRGSTSWVT